MNILSKYNKSRHLIINWLLLVFVLISLNSCIDTDLNEIPLSSVGAENTLVSKAGFEAYINGLVWAAREEYSKDDNTYFITNFPGTDVAEDAGAEYFTYRNWVSYMTPIRGEVLKTWDWAYSKMIPQANTIISYANKSEIESIWENEADKNKVIAEARFFRAYTYNLLANLYGGVPIVDDVVTTPIFDYARNSREEVYRFAKEDLEFASDWLPATTQIDGRIVKATANHLLTEVNISLNLYDEAIKSASDVIDSGLYSLMTSRFGVAKDQPGDVFSDLFIDGNFNRSSGNTESIYVWQFEDLTAGGGGTNNGNQAIRNCGPFLTKMGDSKGFNNVATAELGRGVGRVRGTNYSLYTIWNDPNDIRNSEYNIRRDFYYNNPGSALYGQKISFANATAEDTFRNMYPYPRKVEGTPWNSSPTSGKITDDVYVYRLAETYLLRAEAYMKKGDLANAAKDINTVRARANASPISANDVTLDFILDERARELFLEEPRRRTLIRLGLLVERVRKYGLMEDWRNTIQDYHGLWPIPQDVIDANYGSVIEQNPGY